MGRAVAHAARLDTPQKDGSIPRKHLESSARTLLEKLEGNFNDPRYVAKMAQLDGPPYPYAIEYLRTWSTELYGRSGADMGGVAPLSFLTIKTWAELTGRRVRPHEVDALLWLDGLRRSPPKEDEL